MHQTETYRQYSGTIGDKRSSAATSVPRMRNDRAGIGIAGSHCASRPIPSPTSQAPGNTHSTRRPETAPRKPAQSARASSKSSGVTRRCSCSPSPTPRGTGSHRLCCKPQRAGVFPLAWALRPAQQNIRARSLAQSLPGSTGTPAPASPGEGIQPWYRPRCQGHPL